MTLSIYPPILYNQGVEQYQLTVDVKGLAEIK